MTLELASLCLPRRSWTEAGRGVHHVCPGTATQRRGLQRQQIEWISLFVAALLSRGVARVLSDTATPTTAGELCRGYNAGKSTISHRGLCSLRNFASGNRFLRRQEDRCG